jgi:hypothetical protein
MLIRNLGSTDPEPSTLIKVVGEGYPTIAALAMLCANAISDPPANVDMDQLSDEAKTLLVTAGQRGTFEIRATKVSFDSTERFLAICVESEPEVFLMFRRKAQPRQSIKFFEAFAQLCRYGLMIHHLQKDFSLSTAGYELADTLNPSDFQQLSAFAIEAEG